MVKKDLSFPDFVRVISGFHNRWTGYVLFTVEFGNAGPLVIIRFNIKDMWDVCGCLWRDLEYLGTMSEKAIDLMPDDVISYRLDTSQEPPPEPPPVEPPPIEPPPPEPPPPTTTIKVTITRTPGLPLVVLDWFEDNVTVIMLDANGRMWPAVKTGSKGNEYGFHSCEAGYHTKDGLYTLFIGDNTFSIPIVGNEMVKLHFERVTSEEEMVRLVSDALGRARAEAVLVTLQEMAGTRDKFLIEAL